MMLEWQIIAAVFAVGAASYAMRSGGYLAAGVLPQTGVSSRLLRYAPGNLFVAFVAAGIVEGGWLSLVGCFGAVTAMLITKREWAALGVGFLLVALGSALH